MGKKPAVKLRVFRGETLNYDAKGNVKNNNHLVTLVHKSTAWNLYMKNIKINDFCDVKVEKVLEYVSGEYKEVKNFDKISEEVDIAFNGKKEVAVITQDQKRIAELEAKIDALIGNKKLVKDEETEEDKSLQKENKQKASKEYQEVVGKKPMGTWDAETIKQKQEEFINKKDK